MSKSRRRFAEEEDNRTVFRGHRPRAPREPVAAENHEINGEQKKR